MVPLSWFIDAICLLSAKTAISLGYSPLIGKHIFSFKRPVSASLSYRQTDSSPAFDTNMNLSSAVNESWHGKLYKETTFNNLLQDIKDKGYSLPTKREWEYLAGKGCRSIFPWGNDMDFSMKLRHMEWTDNDDDYTLEKENFFGLHIAFDPYCREIVYEDGVFSYKGGDGGRNICGGLGPVWGYFPISPYFEEKDEETGEYINGSYDFFRRVIRIAD